MNYVFKDVCRSLPIAIFAYSTAGSQINLVRKKTDDVTFEMVIDKKANAKVTGFANVVNYLIGNDPFSVQADFVNWLCNHCDVN